MTIRIHLIDGPGGRRIREPIIRPPREALHEDTHKENRNNTNNEKTNRIMTIERRKRKRRGIE